ncbi:hypothetical protein LMTR3_09890 [Bradyrhizobium sp. LMTR 3]|nr:hypothetical protein LMTR3_09890 [Bradyrhizobium sp. LMTR 3]
MLFALTALRQTVLIPDWLIVGLLGIYGLAIQKLRNADNQRAALMVRALQQETVELPAGNYLFLRSFGDEAAAGLSFAQFAVWIATKLSRVFLAGVLTIMPRTYGWFFPFPIWRVFGGMILLVILINSTFGIVESSRVIFSNLHEEGALLAVLALVILFIRWLLAAALYALLLGGTVTFVWIFLQAIASRAFGWTTFAEGICLEMAVEPLPYGSHVLHMVSWDHSYGLAHATYENRIALLHIRTWTSETLKSSQKPPSDLSASPLTEVTVGSTTASSSLATPDDTSC